MTEVWGASPSYEGRQARFKRTLGFSRSHWRRSSSVMFFRWSRSSASRASRSCVWIRRPKTFGRPDYTEFDYRPNTAKLGGLWCGCEKLAPNGRFCSTPVPFRATSPDVFLLHSSAFSTLAKHVKQAVLTAHVWCMELQHLLLAVSRDAGQLAALPCLVLCFLVCLRVRRGTETPHREKRVGCEPSQPTKSCV